MSLNYLVFFFNLSFLCTEGWTVSRYDESTSLKRSWLPEGTASMPRSSRCEGENSGWRERMMRRRRREDEWKWNTVERMRRLERLMEEFRLHHPTCYWFFAPDASPSLTLVKQHAVFISLLLGVNPHEVSLSLSLIPVINLCWENTQTPLHFALN